MYYWSNKCFTIPLLIISLLSSSLCLIPQLMLSLVNKFNFFSNVHLLHYAKRRTAILFITSCIIKQSSNKRHKNFFCMYYNNTILPVRYILCLFFRKKKWAGNINLQTAYWNLFQTYFSCFRTFSKNILDFLQYCVLNFFISRAILAIPRRVGL